MKINLQNDIIYKNCENSERNPISLFSSQGFMVKVDEKIKKLFYIVQNPKFPNICFLESISDAIQAWECNGTQFKLPLLMSGITFHYFWDEKRWKKLKNCWNEEKCLKTAKKSILTSFCVQAGPKSWSKYNWVLQD